jgi:hypothetical protein
MISGRDYIRKREFQEERILGKMILGRYEVRKL